MYGAMAPKTAAAAGKKAAKAPTETDKLLDRTQESMLEAEPIWLDHGQAVHCCFLALNVHTVVMKGAMDLDAGCSSVCLSSCGADGVVVA